MTTFEKIELGLIPLVGAGFWQFVADVPSLFPGQLGIGRLMLLISALLLFQGLVRDLFLLAKIRRLNRPIQAGQVRQARCMCVESTVGTTGILLGAGLMGAGFAQPVVMANWEWAILVILIMSTGFAIKDLVIDSRPWRIRRDKDHMNILFKW